MAHTQNSTSFPTVRAALVTCLESEDEIRVRDGGVARAFFQGDEEFSDQEDPQHWPDEDAYAYDAAEWQPDQWSSWSWSGPAAYWDDYAWYDDGSWQDGPWAYTTTSRRLRRRRRQPNGPTTTTR